MRRYLKPLACLPLLLLLPACPEESADRKESQKQEQIRQQQVAELGFPAIPNSKEKRDLKELYEMRDKQGLVTYTYLFNEFKGCLMLMGVSDGYGIPYGTQYTAGQRWDGYKMVPQSEPNGLYPPSSADATWVKLQDPSDAARQTKPVYMEPKIITAPFRFTQWECMLPNGQAPSLTPPAAAK